MGDITPTQDDLARDLRADLSELEGRDGRDYEAWVCDNVDHAWPVAIRRALAAEADTEEGRRGEAAAVLAPLLRGLTPREREVLLLRAAGETLAEVGRRLGVTRERVRQVEARALAHARRAAGVQAEGGVRWR